MINVTFSPTEPEDYEGGRTAGDIVRWAEEKAAENVPPPEVKQILGPESLKAGCEEHPLCVVAFLPNILDCQVTILTRFSCIHIYHLVCSCRPCCQKASETSSVCWMFSRAAGTPTWRISLSWATSTRRRIGAGSGPRQWPSRTSNRNVSAPPGSRGHPEKKNFKYPFSYDLRTVGAYTPIYDVTREWISLPR